MKSLDFQKRTEGFGLFSVFDITDKHLDRFTIKVGDEVTGVIKGNGKVIMTVNKVSGDCFECKIKAFLNRESYKNVIVGDTVMISKECINGVYPKK